MTTGYKLQRCTLPYRHQWERCPFYHCVQFKPNCTGSVRQRAGPFARRVTGGCWSPGALLASS